MTLWETMHFMSLCIQGLMMIDELEDRLRELQEYLKLLAPKSATQSESIDYIQVQTYILGFQEAAQIAIRYIND